MVAVTAVVVFAASGTISSATHKQLSIAILTIYRTAARLPEDRRKRTVQGVSATAAPIRPAINELIVPPAKVISTEYEPKASHTPANPLSSHSAHVGVRS